MFGKPGRPREDVFRRRLEIYTAVAPLLEKAGARGLTMRQAAAAAHMSVGGIYHYFPSKRDLVLFVLSPDALERLCQQPQLLAPLEPAGPHAHLATFLEGMVRGVPLLRPAVLAAIELGAGAALDFAEATMTVKVHEFGRALRAVRPGIGEAEAQAIDRAVRHTTLGAMLDRSVSPSELRNELYLIVAMRPLARPRGDGRHVATSF